MKKILALIIVGAFAGTAALADELKVTVNVENGDNAVQIVGADIYATVNGKLAEITVTPDELPFKMNVKAGALRVKSFFMTRKQAEPKVNEVK